MHAGGYNATLYHGCCGSKPQSCSAAPLASHFYTTFNNTIYTNGIPGPTMAPIFSGSSDCANGL
jgi:hypothetical protein